MEKQGNDLQASNSAGMDKVFVFSCPYLGTLEDSDTSLAYPASANHCFRNDSPISIDLSHQETYCLTDQHPGCHVLQMASAAIDTEPVEEQTALREKSKRRLSLYTLPLILILILLAAIIWWPAPGTTLQESLVRGDQPGEEVTGGVTLTGKSVSDQVAVDDPVEIAAPETVVEANAETALNDSPAEEKPAIKAPTSAESDEKNENDSTPSEASSATAAAADSAPPAPAAITAESEQETTTAGSGQSAKEVFVETEVIKEETAAPEEKQTTATESSSAVEESSSASNDAAAADEDVAASEIEEISAIADDSQTDQEAVASEEADEALALETADLPVISMDAIAVAAAPGETIATNNRDEGVIMVGPVASTALSLGDASEEVNPLIVYESSAADGAILALIESRQFVTFLGRDKSGAWLNIRLADGLEGWINANQSGANLDTSRARIETVSNRPTASSYPIIRYAYVDTGALNLRTGPGVEYEPFTIINKGEIVGLIGRRALGPWVRVRLDDGSEGWVNSSLLAPVS